VTADVTEALGSEIHVIFMVDAPPVGHPGAAALATGGGDDSAISLAAGKSAWTARVSARSKITPGRPMELGVDTASLYFFDPGSGRTVTGGGRRSG
jgi:multiple sugar transport system ATP-binding protein